MATARAAAKKAAKKDDTLYIPELQRGTMLCAVIGDTPLIINRVSQKAQRELLFPQKKTAADRAGNLKHDPLAEFRDSAYTLRDDAAPTVLAMPGACFKGAMRSAALRCEGATKQLIGEMLSVPADMVPIYGVPQVFCAITRNSDIGHTPDVRTRCIVSPWAALLQVSFVKPFLNEQAVFNLLMMAGATQGVGDGRNNKGWASYGSFRPVAPTDAGFKLIMEQHGRTTQLEHMQDPAAYDVESEELLSWFDTEVHRRGMVPPLKVAA